MRQTPRRLYGLAAALAISLGVCFGMAQEGRAQPAAAAPDAAAPSRTPDQELPLTGPPLERRTLTGDPFGARGWLERHGISFDVYATQYLMGVVDGGRRRGFRSGGRLDAVIAVDGERAGLWPGLFINALVETRYGQDINGLTSAFSAPQFAMGYPTDSGTATRLTQLVVTQALSERFVLFAGKLNVADDYALRFLPQVTGPARIGGFLNTSLISNPILARTFPYSTAGAGFAILQEGETMFSLTAFDPEERADRGLDRLFARGVVLVPDLTLRGKLAEYPFILNLGGSYSSAAYTSVAPSSYLAVPPDLLLANLAQGIFPERRNSWSVYANVYQAIWTDGPRRNFGVFVQAGLADGEPNPLRWILTGGLAGSSPLPGRARDTFGVGVYRLAIDDEVRRLARPFLPQRDETGLEAFYSLALTPWARLTFDAQALRPSTVQADTAVAVGMRFTLRL